MLLFSPSAAGENVTGGIPVPSDFPASVGEADGLALGVSSSFISGVTVGVTVGVIVESIVGVGVDVGGGVAVEVGVAVRVGVDVEGGVTSPLTSPNEFTVPALLHLEDDRFKCKAGRTTRSELPWA